MKKKKIRTWNDLFDNMEIGEVIKLENRAGIFELKKITASTGKDSRGKK